MAGLRNISLIRFPHQHAKLTLQQEDQAVDRVLAGSERTRVRGPFSANQLVTLLAVTIFVGLCFQPRSLRSQQPTRHRHATPALTITGTDGSQTGTAGFQGNFNRN